MVLTYALASAALAVILLATAAFGADGPTLSLFLSGLLVALGATASALRPRPRLGGAIWLGLWGAGVVALGQTLGPSPREALPDMAVLMGAGAVYLAIAGAASTSERADGVLRLVYLALVLVGLAAFLDFVTSPGTLYGQAKAYHETRLTAAFLSANTAATLFGMATMVGLGGVLRAVGPMDGAGAVSLFDRIGRSATLPLLVLIFSLTCLVLTGSRGGMAATGLAGAGLFFWDRRRGDGWKVTAIAGALLVIGAAVILVVSGDVIGGRLVEGATEANGRGTLWAVCVEAWREAPLFGHGFGRFEAAIAPHITAETASVLSQQGAAHNIALQWLVQAGLVGSVGGLAIIGAALWPIAIGLKRRRRQRTILKASAAAAVVVMLHGVLDYGVEIPAITWWLSAILGLGAGIAAADKAPRRSGSKRKRA